MWYGGGALLLPCLQGSFEDCEVPRFSGQCCWRGSGDFLKFEPGSDGAESSGNVTLKLSWQMTESVKLTLQLHLQSASTGRKSPRSLRPPGRRSGTLKLQRNPRFTQATSVKKQFSWKASLKRKSKCGIVLVLAQPRSLPALLLIMTRRRFMVQLSQHASSQNLPLVKPFWCLLRDVE